MICLEDVKGMIAEHVGKHGKHPSKISITAYDYDIIRYECMMLTKMDCATAEDVKVVFDVVELYLIDARHY